MRHLFHSCIALCIFTACAAQAHETLIVKGQEAYGDWTKDTPEERRLIRPDDMPQPHATSSVSNGPKTVPQPAAAVLNVPEGFTVSAFLTGLKEPRQMRIAPNGDIFLAESGALRIRVIKAAAQAQTAASATIFADNLAERPYGIAFYPPGGNPRYVYVATEGHVLRYAYHTGDIQASGKPEIIAELPKGHHWTRDVIFTPDGSKMLVSVGSGSNDAEDGMEEEQWRANVLEYNPDGTGGRVYASGLRNPVTLAFEPRTKALWTTVNERDGLGDDLPPDYVTSVMPGGFYGWPWYYIGAHADPKYKDDHPRLRNKVLVPDVLFQAHSAPLGLAFYTGTQFPENYHGDLFVALHGSWNRAKRTGYKLVRVPFYNGKAAGEYDDFLTGFVTKEGDVWGRPVGVAVAQDGALLMSDDVSGTVWRIGYKNQSAHPR